MARIIRIDARLITMRQKLVRDPSTSLRMTKRNRDLGWSADRTGCGLSLKSGRGLQEFKRLRKRREVRGVNMNMIKN